MLFLIEDGIHTTLASEHKMVGNGSKLIPTLSPDYTNGSNESDTDTYEHFIVEDPLRMLRHRKNTTWSVVKPSVESEKDDEFASVLKTETPATNVAESVAHTPTDNAVQMEEALATTPDVSDNNNIPTNVWPLFNEHRDSVNYVDSGTTNNHTIVYRKRL